MDISEYINIAARFYHSQPLVVLGCGLFLLFLIYRQPRFFLGVFLLALFLAAVAYVIFDAASSSTSLKKNLLEKGNVREVK
ncbi:MAG: hypothetical protein M0Z79_08260 [Nitrospiraceae bacterium]|nr:hypothetical protein [Nitrospiraceae bacterium]